MAFSHEMKVYFLIKQPHDKILKGKPKEQHLRYCI